LNQETIATVVSRLDSIVTGATKLGVAYAGYKSVDHWGGALVGLVALRLAEGGNIAAGGAGLATLGAIGVASIPVISDRLGDDYAASPTQAGGFDLPYWLKFTSPLWWATDFLSR